VVSASSWLEQLANHRLKVRQRRALVIDVECWRVILRTELFGVLEVLIAAELLTSVLVKADVVPEVVPLEDAVVLHHPPVRFRDKWLQDAGGDVGVIERRKVVANVVNE